MKNSKSKTRFYKIQAKQLKIQIIINNNNKELKQEKENGKFISMLVNIFSKWIDNLKK